MQIEEKEQLSLDPNFWNDPAKAQGVLKSLKIDKNWVKGYNELQSQIDDVEVLYEYYKEGEATEEEVDQNYEKALTELEDLEFKSTLNKPEDELSCILEINAAK